MTEDPRAMRSRALLHFAVRDLMASQGMANLSVASLCRRAGVHRTTFYQHYEDLAACVTDAVVEPVATELARAIHEEPVPWAEGEVDEREIARWSAAVRTKIDAHTGLLAAVLSRGNDVGVLHDLVAATAWKLSGSDQVSCRMRIWAVIALTVVAGSLEEIGN